MFFSKWLVSAYIDDVLVDKLEQMLGSYGPSATGEPYAKNFDSEEMPGGLVARSGTYTVQSRVIDDDGNVYAGMLPHLLFSIELTALTWILAEKTLSGHSSLLRIGEQ